MLVDEFISDLNKFDMKPVFTFKGSDVEKITSAHQESIVKAINSREKMTCLIFDSINNEVANSFSTIISSTQKLVMLGLKSVSHEVISILLKNIPSNVGSIEIQELDYKATIVACNLIEQKEVIRSVTIRKYEHYISALNELKDCKHLQCLRLFYFTTFPINDTLPILNSMHIETLYIDDHFDKAALETLKTKLKKEIDLRLLPSNGQSRSLKDQKNNSHDKIEINKHTSSSPQQKKLERSSSHSSPSPTHHATTTHSSPSNNNRKNENTDASSQREKYSTSKNNSDEKNSKFRGNNCRTVLDTQSSRDEDKKRYHDDKRHHDNDRDSDEENSNRSAKKRDFDDKERTNQTSHSKNSSDIYASPNNERMHTEKINYSHGSPELRHGTITSFSSPVINSYAMHGSSKDLSSSRRSGNNRETSKKDMHSSQENMYFNTHPTLIESDILTRQPKKLSFASPEMQDTHMKTTSTTAMIIVSTSSSQTTPVSANKPIEITSTPTPMETTTTTTTTSTDMPTQIDTMKAITKDLSSASFTQASSTAEEEAAIHATSLIPRNVEKAFTDMALKLVEASAAYKNLGEEYQQLQDIVKEQASIIKDLLDKISTKQSDIQSRKFTNPSLSLVETDIAKSPAVNVSLSPSTRSIPNPSLPSLNNCMAKKQKTSKPEEKIKLISEEDANYLRSISNNSP